MCHTKTFSLIPSKQTMQRSEAIQKYDFVTPTEENDYCIFREELENNSLVLFHATPLNNLTSIVTNGFYSAARLGVGELSSVSYAKRSSGCLAHMGEISKDFVVFAVEFRTLDQEGITVNHSDIHVYREDIQPIILRYCEVPEGAIKF